MTKFLSSLRVRLVLFVILAALPALALTIYSGNEQRQRAEARVQSDVLRLSQLASITQENFIESTRIFLVSLSHMPAMHASDMTECRDLFFHLFTEHYPQFSSFYVADLNANILCDAPNTHRPTRLKDCEHYNELITANDFVYSNYHICKESGKAIMAMGYPLSDDQGDIYRVINISIDLSWLNELAAKANLPPGFTLSVFDQEGNYLTHYPNPDKFIGISLDEKSHLYPLFTRGEGTDIAIGTDGVERIYATTPMENAKGSVIVILGVPTSIAYAEANRTTTRNLVFLGIATLLAALAAAGLAELLIMRRTRVLLETTQRLAAGDLSARTSIPHDAGELGQLASSFDQMADSLEQRALERDQAEASMREYATELERSNRELQDFANVASHDMQEPLRKILTFSELLQTRYNSDLDERGRDYLQRMDNAATRLYNLINDLLAYSRITTRAQPFVTVNLNEVARKVLGDLDLQIEESHAQVELTSLPTLEADPTQMYQLLQNLVSNALKYHQPGQPPQIRITAPAESEISDGLRQFQVSDAGIGFEEKYLDRIFQPFQRLHRSTEFEGTGMGLAICRKIVERHGGNISAHSAPGKGTTFTISLPARHNSGGTPS